MPDKATRDQLLGSTARWTAGVRARESLREDRLFNDPWATALAGEEGEEWAEHRSGDNGASIAIRTRFFDDFLQHVTGEYAVRQVVLMAAGLDTRAFRLSWPKQTRIFELDQAQVLEYKEQALLSAGAQPDSQRQAIAVDLTGPWTEILIKRGFDPQQHSAWLLEGFLVYLPNGSVTRILDEVTSLAAPGSWIGFDIINSTMLTSPWTRQWVERMTNSGVPWIGTMDDPEEFLATRGWKARLGQPGEEEAHFGRWPYPAIPQMIPDMPRYWFVTAQKK